MVCWPTRGLGQDADSLGGKYAVNDKNTQTEAPQQKQMVSAGLWLVSAFVVLSLTNYLFSLVMSRKLSVEDYGSFGVISSVLLLEGLVASAGFPWVLNAVVSRNDADEHVMLRARTLGAALAGNIGIGLVSGGCVALVVARLIPHHPLVPLLVALTALTTCINAVWYGLFNGERRFPLLAGIRSGEACLKVVLGTWLVVAGWGLAGAVAGSTIPSALMVFFGASRVRSIARPRRQSWSQASSLRTVLWTMVAQLGLALLMNIDILGVRALAHGAGATAGAGYYQAAAVLARAPVLVGISILNAGFPFLARRVRATGDAHRLIGTLVRALGLGPLPVALILSAAPAGAIGYFFPASYAPAAVLLRVISLTAFPLVALSLVVTTLQAIDGMRRGAIAVVPAVTLEAVLLVVLVPRFGAIGAAWAALAGAVPGMVVAVRVMPRRWRGTAASHLPRLIIAWAVVAGAAATIRVPARLWIVEAAGLYTLFLVLAWLLRALSAAELEPVVPKIVRPPVTWLMTVEKLLRSR